MKTACAAFVICLLVVVSCKKNSDTDPGSNSVFCTGVTITNTSAPCSNWSIKLKDGSVYPSANIPDEFKQEGRFVCARWELYEDMRLCVCCGGTWANIKSMKYFTR